MTRPRTISPDVAWKAARAALSRLACDYGDLLAEHDHEECLRDDVAYAADLQLRLLAAIAGGDDDTILARLGELQEALDTGD